MSLLKRLLVQISMVSLREILVKIESMSKLPITLLQSCSKNLVEQLNKFLIVYLAVVDCSRIATKNFTNLYVGVCKTNKMVLKANQSLTNFLWTLQEPYIIPGIVPTGFKCLFVYLDRIFQSTNFLQILLMRFS